MVEPTGFEPATSSVQARCSPKLSYDPIYNPHVHGNKSLRLCLPIFFGRGLLLNPVPCIWVECAAQPALEGGLPLEFPLFHLSFHADMRWVASHGTPTRGKGSGFYRDPNISCSLILYTICWSHL